MNSPIPLDFTNVVDQSEQLPLDIDLGFRTEGKVVQAFLHAEIGKDWLDDGQTPGIDLPACRGVDPVFHLFDQSGLRALYF